MISFNNVSGLRNTSQLYLQPFPSHGGDDTHGEARPFMPLLVPSRLTRHVSGTLAHTLLQGSFL